MPDYFSSPSVYKTFVSRKMSFYFRIAITCTSQLVNIRNRAVRYYAYARKLRSQCMEVWQEVSLIQE